MKSIILMLAIVCTLPALSFGQEFVMERPTPKKNSVGLGLGIPYGGVGVNLNVNLVSNLYFTAGVGTTVLASAAYCVGVKYFFTPAPRSFRPRASAYYGITTIVEKQYPQGKTEDDTYAGIVLGRGSQWMWGQSRSNGFDFDLLYIAQSNFDPDELRAEGFIPAREPGDFKISIGYRHAF